MSEGIRLKPFDGSTDFAIWKIKMKAILIKEKCFAAVTEDWPANTSDLRKAELREIAHSEIMIRLADDVVRQVVSFSDPKLLWEGLESIFQSKSMPSRISLLSKLFTFKMDTGMSMHENFDAFLKMTQDLERCGDQIDDTHQAVLLLNSMPSQFDNLKDVIQFSRDDLTVRKISEAISQKEETLKVFKSKTKNKPEVKSEPKSEALMAKSKGKNKRWKSKKDSNQNSNDTGSGSNSKSEVVCFYCGKKGHYAKDCNLRAKHDKNKENEKNGTSNVCESCPAHEMLVVDTTGNSADWILDSGCNIHATPFPDMFSKLTKNEGGDVMLGNHSTLRIKGHGSVPMRMFDGQVRIITNVKWVPALRRNLLSESIFDDLGCRIVTNTGIKDIVKDGRVVIRSVKRGGLYHVVGSPELNAVDQKNQKNNHGDMTYTSLWHNRLGHIGHHGLVHLFKDGLLEKHPCDLKFCEDCILGKKSRHTFGKSTFIAKSALEYVHADLWGPAQVDTIGGRKYFLSLIDQHSRKVWVILLKTKDQAFESFKTWKSLVENQVDKRLKCLRTDNGLEFCNKEFKAYCEDHGIKRHLTVPGTPQQNGTAERMNRTLLEKARCMLISAGLKSSLWGEAVVTAAYLINRSPSSAISFKTPQEMWTGKKPNLSHLRPFGCTAYSQISQGKLNPRAQKCVMLGYPEGVKGYKLLLVQPGGYKVVVSRDVTFNETEFYYKDKLTSDVEFTGETDLANNETTPGSYFYIPEPRQEDAEPEFDIGRDDSGHSITLEGHSDATDSSMQPHQSGGEESDSTPEPELPPHQ
ncbi:Retrovirus-related Pol polyprotein from transposon TNT 1-94 [Linum grandiflorum]